MSSIQSLLSKNGYYLAKGVYDSSQLPGMQDDFDRIVQQLLASKENINARWGSQLTRELEDTDSVVYHTHNVQCYSAIWLQAFLTPDFLEHCHTAKVLRWARGPGGIPEVYQLSGCVFLAADICRECWRPKRRFNKLQNKKTIQYQL